MSKGVSLFANHQQAKIDKQRRSDELEMAKINAQKETQVASYKHDSDLGQASLWVASIQKLMRPGITIYSLSLITLFWFYATSGDRSIIAAGVLDLASMAVSWWFKVYSILSYFLHRPFALPCYFVIKVYTLSLIFIVLVLFNSI